MKKKDKPELFELSSLRSRIDPAVYAGLKEQQNWKANTMVGLEEFEKAAAQFMGR